MMDPRDGMPRESLSGSYDERRARTIVRSPISVRNARIEVHRVSERKRIPLASDGDSECSRENIDELNARMTVRLQFLSRNPLEFGVVRVQFARVRRII